MAARRRERRASVWPWLLLVAWIAVIWGHSLVPGTSSAEESYHFVSLAQKAVYVIYQQHFSLVDRLAAEHPYFLRSLTDPEVMHFYVRKAGHFTEYFVLAGLTVNAVSRSSMGAFASVLVTLVLWAGTPCADEWIQLHVPGRAGQATDVLIDMAGFGTGLAVGLAIWAVCAIIAGLMGALFGGGRDSDIGTDPYDDYEGGGYSW